MARISFTPNLARHIDTPSAQLEGHTVQQVLDHYFRSNPRVRAYLLDDQGAVRKHVAVFVNQSLIQDRVNLSDPVKDNDEIFVVQALSGG